MSGNLGELYSELKGRERIDTLNELAWEMRVKDGNRAMAIASYVVECAGRGSRPYTKGRAMAETPLAMCHWLRDQYREALPLAATARERLKKVRDSKCLGIVSTVLGLIHWKLNQPEAAWDAWQEAHGHFSLIRYTSGIANSLMNLALLLRNDGQLDAAKLVYLRSLKLMNREGNTMGVANIQNNIGVIDLETGELKNALYRFRSAFLGQKRLHNYRAASNALCNLAITYLRLDRCGRAEILLRLSDRYCEYGGYSEPLPHVELARIENWLHPNCVNPDPEAALRSAQALQIREIDFASRLKLGQLLCGLYERMGQKGAAISAFKALVKLHEERFSTQWKFRLGKINGIELWEEEEAKALPALPLNPVSLLSPRQKRIFDFIGEGLMNKEIASELGLSVHTVQAHRRKIAEKLGISGFELSRLAARLR